MKILVIGTTENQEECKLKFGTTHTYQVGQRFTSAQLEWADVVFDFLLNPETFDVNLYNHYNRLVFLNSTFTTLSKLIHAYVGKATFIGFCGLSTFLNRDVLEVCITNKNTKIILEDACKQLNTQYGLVADQVGFVTPRIICMIINEAYYTVEEGTAKSEDIDLAMKLGTNYPFGPFEWATRIGKKNIVALLNSIQQVTGDSRYQVCELLKKNAH
ncbi:MAG: 3-hydroxyacyl-CoA dehydrogenase [Cyclobacteriaceae bacterium]|nr:3-hydroxyacyl-CoA dehydrogenase [Cyclobacteriaceae bacterium]